MKLLIVDDERAILEETIETLADEGFDCLAASDVDKALELLRADEAVRIVVTDLFLPGKTGVDLITIAKQEFPGRISFIVVSGHGSPTVELKDLDKDDYVFMRKPLDVDKLLDVIERLGGADPGSAGSTEEEK